jgi:hypothetical protein
VKARIAIWTLKNALVEWINWFVVSAKFAIIALAFANL